MGLGVFPNPRAARVLWAGVTEPPPLLASAVSFLEEFAAQVGIPPDPMKFSPHITLGRFKKDPGEHWWTKFGEMEKEDYDFAPLDAVTLYQSTGGEESSYHRLARIALGSGGDLPDEKEGPVFYTSGGKHDEDE